ncbi:GIY-YIG nuclease family protein [Chryseobacterium sp. T20]|uniref:GIY-YIG nuclease family protein n=1 Tax=Chryseobacterium sp. T20 TaxID=3395375 RepID=UPI0039BCF5DF
MNQKTKDFFEKHKILEREIIDAKGQTMYQLKDFMKSQNKLFAYNTTACNQGHTIKDRNGHCIVCKTASITFLRRSLATGNIYIAGSIAKEYIKIGMSTVPLDQRFTRLNSRRVGNTNDWVLIKSIKCDFVNKHELAIHKLLKKYKIDGDKYGDTESTEIFRCSYEKANATLEQYFEENNIEKIETKTFLYNPEKYSFRNLINSNNM